MKVFRTFDARLRQNLLILFTAGLLFWSSMGSLLPTLPLYVEHVGATKQQIGIVMGSFAIGLLLSRPWLGKTADRRGRKIVLLIGTLVAAIAPFGFLVVKSIPLLMVLRAFHGISIAAFTTGYLALVADLSDETNRGEVIGNMSLVTPIGLAIGPAIGGYLQAGVGYTALFVCAGAFGGLAALCLLAIVNPPIQTSEPGENNDNQLWRILISPRVRIPAVVMLLIGLAFGTLHTFAPLFIKSTGVDLNAGLFYTAGAIASFSVRLFAGKASDRLGRGLFITISLVIYTAAMLLLWKANSAQTFLFAAIIEGAGAGTLMPMMSTMIADRALPQERGRIFAVCIAGLDMGIAISGPVLGSIAEQVGYRDMFGYAAMLVFLAFLIFITMSGKDLANSFRFAIGRIPDVYALNPIKN
ncbi:MFS transporter [Scytonema hofmannii FACHB-248]|uniref:MFS transporter n=1 Tax=Scytonema hofmannii FACHB-248 TaxID=1842502 RepID=A0ABR8H051_9CYAN|nr:MULTISPECIES: MFS transporter [Nostocales]MBD2608827.1 MFS transporter [Scytonema hofmannii FACHB-248]